MLGVGGLPPPSAPPLVRKRATSIKPNFSNLIQDQAHKAHLSLDALSNYSQLSLGRTGFRLFAQTKQQGSNFRSIELVKEADFEEEDGFEIDEFDDDFDDEDGDFDEEDEDDDLMVPFHKMDAWLKNKPRGFGEGKVYDTLIEDKLLEEIEQSREAQLANVNKLKNEPKEPICKRELKVAEGVPTGIRVRINNLPKKKNIHRDLNSAFEGVRGIINISPVVSGNKKTREPVCKGFGFLDFKSLEDANRFVQTFSGQNITFGKVQKPIRCDILKPSDAGYEGSVHNNVYKSTFKSRSTLSEDQGDQDSDTEQINPPLQLWEDDNFDESDEELDDEDIINISKLLTSSGLKEKSTTDSASSMHEQKSKAVKKKSMAGKKSDKINHPLQLWEDDDYDESDEELDEDIIDISELLTSSGLKKKSTTDSALSMHEQKSKAVRKKSMARKKPAKINPPLQLWEDDESDEELDDEDVVDISELLTSSGLKKKSTTDSALSMYEQKRKAVKKKSTARKKPDKINPSLQLWRDDDYDESDEELDDEDIVDISELLTSSGLRKKSTTDSASSMHKQKSKAVKKKSAARKQPDKINSPLQLWEDDDYDESDEEFDDEDIIDISELLTSSGLKKKSTTDSASSMHEQKTKAVKKKSTARKKPDKISKLNIPGSAKRLKVQEKAKLADVFSRYGSKEALASKQM